MSFKGNHILYLHQYFVPPGGNGSIRSYTIARQLADKGYRVTLITTSARFGDQYSLLRKINKLRVDGIDLIVLKINYSNRLSYLRRIKAFIEYALLTACVTLRIDPPDLVYATSTPLTVAIPALLAIKRFGIPFIFEVRDVWPEVPIAMGVVRNRLLIWLLRRFEKLVYARAEHIIALSTDMAHSILQTPVSEDKVSVVTNFSDNKLFSVGARPGRIFRDRMPFVGDRPLVLYTGTFGKVNDLGYLIRLAGAMLSLDPEVAFLLVGGGMEEEALRTLAAQIYVLNRNLYFLPRVPKNRLPELLSAATVTVSTVANIPALWKNSANKLFDALAAGKPIMINHYGWQADLLRSRNVGLVVPPDDPVKGAELLNAFIRNEKQYILACSEAKRLAEEEFDSSTLVGKIESIISRLLRAEQLPTTAPPPST